MLRSSDKLFDSSFAAFAFSIASSLASFSLLIQFVIADTKAFITRVSPKDIAVFNAIEAACNAIVAAFAPTSDFTYPPIDAFAPLRPAK